MDTRSMPPWENNDMRTSSDCSRPTVASADLAADAASAGGEVHARGEPVHMSVDTGQEQAQLMSTLRIRRDGAHYCFRNYCSVRLQDAVNYARLVAKRELLCAVDKGGLPRRTSDGDAKPPGESVAALMASPGRSFDDGRDVVDSVHYGHLADAVAYGRLRQLHP
jgi:hypothetical protein